MKNVSEKLWIIVLLLLGAMFLSPNYSYGAAITNSADDLSRLAKNTPSNHELRFTTPSGAGDSSDSIIILFPNGFNLSAITLSDIDLTHGPLTGDETVEVLAGTSDGTSWGVSVLGQNLTLTHPTDENEGDITPGDIIKIKIGTNAQGGSNQIVNGLGGNYTIGISGTFGDSGLIPIAILDDDQITANINVLPSISLTLSSTVSSFGLVDLGSITTSNPDIVLTVQTNHSNGYSVRVSDRGNNSNPGLFNSQLGILVGSASTNYENNIDLNSVIGGYGIQAECVSGCITQNNIAARYRVADDIVAGMEISPDVILSDTTYLTEEHKVRIRHRAKISQYTRTGTYVDTITYQATANY